MAIVRTAGPGLLGAVRLAHLAAVAVAGDDAGECPPGEKLHELGQEGVATIHVRTQYEKSTCAREMGSTNQLVPEDSSLGHLEITCNSFNSKGLCGIVRVLDPTLARWVRP